MSIVVTVANHHQCSAFGPTAVELWLQVGPGGLGLRLSTLSGGRLWAQVWFGQPTTLRVPRNRDSSGESAKGLTRDVVGGDGHDVGCAAF